MSTSSTSFFNRPVLRRKVRVFAVAIVVLTILGPFGTYEAFNTADRIAYWSILLVICGLIFEVAVPWFLYNQRLARRISRWPKFIIGVLAGSFCATWVVFVVEHSARGPVDFTVLPWLFVYVATISFIICFVSFMPPFAHVAMAPNVMDIDFERIAFYNNYPHLKGSRIRWITIEDHYARVVMDTHEVSLHASMRELEQQLENYPGVRIHRSHWVAEDTMRRIDRDGRNMTIDVGDDTKLPLGGTYQERVERIFTTMTRA